MIVTDDGFSIDQHPNKNRITITLPPTMETINATTIHFDKIVSRKIKLNESELLLILNLVRWIMMDGKETDLNG